MFKFYCKLPGIFQSKLMKFPDKEYTKYHSDNKPWESGILWAAIVLFIFLLFQPFGFRDKDKELKLVLFPAYSLLAYFFSVSNFFIVRRILKLKKLWTLKNEFLYILADVFPATLLVHLLSYWATGDMPFNLYWYVKLLYHVSSLFMIIGVIEFLYYTNKSSDSRVEHLSSQIKLVSQQLHCVKKESDTETVLITLENDSIHINRNKTIFIKSISNYLEFYFRETDGQIKKLIKRGRIHLVEKDLEPIPEFLRCHRAFIVNLKQAKQIKGSSKNARLVFVQKLEEIPVSRTKFKTLKELLDKIIAE